MEGGARVQSAPAQPAATPLVRPVTSTGGFCCVGFVPSPSWPKLLSPQHLTPPAVVRAQVWKSPAETIASGSPVAEAGPAAGQSSVMCTTAMKESASSPHFQGLAVIFVIANPLPYGSLRKTTQNPRPRHSSGTAK